MALFRLLLMLAIVAGVAGAGLYFAPDSVKEQVLSYVNSNPYVPSEIKSEVEKLYATPAMKREKLITELTGNLSVIQSYIEGLSSVSASSSPEVKLLTRSQEIIDQVLKINADPGAVKQITDAVAAKLIASNSCPLTP